MNARPESRPLVILALAGSLRQASVTRRVLALALDGAAELGAEVRLLDLRELHLPFCDARDDASYPDDVFRLRREVGRADGLILGTPEYHGSFSGVLKNALDLMGFDELEGKPIGLVGVAGGAPGAGHALSHLRTVGRSLHAWVIPDEASVPSAHKAFDAEGRLKNRSLETRLRKVGREVARFAEVRRLAISSVPPPADPPPSISSRVTVTTP